VKAALFAVVIVSSMEAASVLGGCAKPPQVGEPLRDLTPEQLASFNAGKVIFAKEFEPDEGLGPLFNAPACGECHEEPELGGSGDENETHAAVAGANGSCDLLIAHGGPVFQAHTTPALKRALGIDAEPIPVEATARATRTSPDLFGFGLLDAVPDDEILARADSADRDHDGISGRVNRTPDGRIGRFGRKGFGPTLAEFNAGAFLIEMGITNPTNPVEETIGGKPIPAGVDSTPDPELSAEALQSVFDFVRFLAPPPQQPLSLEGEHGRQLFRTMGCISCHTPALVTGPNRVRALDRKVVAAYTDLLLHDMGPERADICLGLASPSEFRTEPLMGLHLESKFLHDGAATTIEQAIELHAGEATRARDYFAKAPPKEREALLAFLKSL
jgi:CxxC motif-containing protein (DUF1111 family)